MTVSSAETAAASGTGPMLSTQSEIEPLRQQQLQQKKPVDRLDQHYLYQQNQ